MKPMYFETHEKAEQACAQYIDQEYPNKFQDALSIARIKIIEFDKGFAIQFGDYGPYFEKRHLECAA